MTLTPRLPRPIASRLAVLALTLAVVLGAAATAAAGVGTSTGVAADGGSEVALSITAKADKASPK